MVALSLVGCGGGTDSAGTGGSTQAPSIGGTPATGVVAGTAYSFQPSASGPAGAALTFSVQGLPGWATFDAANGKLQGTPAPADVGAYSGIIISVSDGAGSAALPAFAIQVTQMATGSATVSWQVPLGNTDGSALANTDISGFRVYYGTNAANLSQSVTVNGTGVLTKVIDSLSPATWYFAVSVLNSGGVESSRSNVVNTTVQ